MLQLFSKHVIDHYESAYNKSFMTVIPNHYSKYTLIGTFHVEKIAKAVLLYVFIISLLASPFKLPGHFEKTYLRSLKNKREKNAIKMQSYKWMK